METTNNMIATCDLPIERAARHFENSKQLSMAGQGSSLEAERIIKEIYKATSYIPSVNILHYLFLGKIYKQQLDITSAITCYRIALREQPTNLVAKKLLFELLVIKGQELMILANKLKSDVRYHAARSYFDEALEVDKENTKLWILKTICHIHAKELTEAFEAINRVIKPSHHPTAEMYILRAKIYWGRGLIEQGNGDIKIAFMLDPNHPEVIAFATRSNVKAEYLYKESVRLFTIKKYKEALLSVNHAIHITTEDVKLLIMKSKIHRVLNELQHAYESITKAKEIFEKALEDTNYPLELPRDISLQTNLILNEMAIDYAMKGEYDKAILILTNIIKNETRIDRNGLVNIHHKYYVNRGDCYRALNKLNDAIYDYMLAHQINSKDWEIRTRLSLTHYLIGIEYFNHTLYPETENELSKAIMFNPKVFEYYVVRGKTLYYQSNFTSAYKDFKKAFELNHNNEEVKHWLAQFSDEFMNDKNNIKKVNHNNKHHLSKSLDINNNILVSEDILKLKITQDDMIDMMLHPKKANKLPIMKLLIKNNHRNNNHLNHTTPLIVLPPIEDCNPLQRAYYASIELNNKQDILINKYNEKHDNNKGSLWGLIETAKEIAFKKSHPDGYATGDNTITSNKKNTTNTNNKDKNNTTNTSTTTTINKASSNIAMNNKLNISKDKKLQSNNKK